MAIERVKQYLEQIAASVQKCGRLSFMEVCGTHTVSLFRSGVKSQLPEGLRLISGPGCPVCVTSQGYIDAACDLATREGINICTYGDMVRVPGGSASLESRRAEGAKVTVVYSARDAVRLAAEHPDRTFVFLAVGFETTAPATAAALLEADKKNLQNFFVLMGHKLVIPAMQTLLSAGEVPIDGFLCPGHVSVIIGSDAYKPIVEQYQKPCVVTGFEPEQMLAGIAALARQMENKKPALENVYQSVVSDQGNPIAQQLMNKVFIPADTVWRAMGTIPASGLELQEPYKRFDALAHFNMEIGPDYDPPGCRCGEVIQGKVEPIECSLFGNRCTPAHPVGPCMVSSEGTCAAWYKYGRGQVAAPGKVKTT